MFVTLALQVVVFTWFFCFSSRPLRIWNPYPSTHQKKPQYFFQTFNDVWIQLHHESVVSPNFIQNFRYNGIFKIIQLSAENCEYRPNPNNISLEFGLIILTSPVLWELYNLLPLNIFICTLVPRREQSGDHDLRGYVRHA